MPGKFTGMIQGTLAPRKKLPIKYCEGYYTNASAFHT
jgi:hypothetical protein